jgi:hypothetical protein
MDEAGVTEILRRLEIQVRDKSSFGTALGLLAILVTSRDDVAEVISAGEKVGVIPPASLARIQEIASDLSRGRTALKEVLEETSLANEVAPSFQSLTIATELRFGFEEARIARFVPVAICHLSTDSQHSRCFFQMTKKDVTQAGGPLIPVSETVPRSSRLFAMSGSSDKVAAG